MKPTAKRGTQTIRGMKNVDGNWRPNPTTKRVDMFQRDIDLIEKLKQSNFTTGDQEYPIGALYHLATHERDKFNWKD